MGFTEKRKKKGMKNYSLNPFNLIGKLTVLLMVVDRLKKIPRSCVKKKLKNSETKLLPNKCLELLKIPVRLTSQQLTMMMKKSSLISQMMNMPHIFLRLMNPKS